MNQMKMANRLFLGFGFFALIGLVFGILNFGVKEPIRDNLTGIQNVYIPGLKGLLEISAYQKTIIAAERSLLGKRMMSPELRRNQHELIAETWKKTENMKAQLEPIFSDPDISVLTGKFNADWDAWKNNRQLIKYLFDEIDKKITPAADLDNAEMKDLEAKAVEASIKSEESIKAVAETIDKMVTVGSLKIGRLMDSAQRNVGTFASFAGLFVAFTIIFAILACWYFPKNYTEIITGITREVHAIKEAVAVGKLSIRADPSNVDFELHPAIEDLNAIIAEVAAPISVATNFANRISNGETLERITDNFKGDFENLKLGINKSMDEISVLVNEIGVVIGGAREGKLAVRANPDRTKGVYRKILRGVNDAWDAVIGPLHVAAEHIDQIAKGETQNKITDKFKGDFNIIGDNINKVLDEIGILVEETGVLINAAREGKLNLRANPDRTKGVYRKILRGVNDAWNLLINPLHVAADYVGAISQGEIPSRITDNYNGDFNEIKNHLNMLIDAMNEITDVAEEIARGNVMVEVKERSEADKLMKALNTMIVSMKTVTNIAQEIAGGNLTIEVKERSPQDELMIALGIMVRQLSGIVVNVKAVAEKVAVSSSELSTSAVKLSQCAAEQASSIEEISSTMTEIDSQTKINAENATQANQLASKARSSAENGDAQMLEMVAAMKEINESSRMIAKIIKVIDDIAFQTNLLALNAAVEAARAGRHGKGFAVVADEVRNLAGRSAKAAKETAEMIDSSVKRVNNGSQIAEKTEASLKEIVDSAVKMADLVGEIAAASNEQAQGVSQIRIALNQIDQVTQENTANADETAAASQDLNEQAEEMKMVLSKFRLKADEMNASLSNSQKSKSAAIMQNRKSGADHESKTKDQQTAKKKPGSTAEKISLDDHEFGKY